MRTLAMFLCGAASTALVAPALAQNSTAGNNEQQGLQEIIVTAQKRAENAQDVPIAIQVLSSENLTKGGVSDLNDLATLVPGFVGPSDGVRSGARLRGVGSQVPAPGLESAIAYYIDGVYIAEINKGLLGLNNAERVEVLKGPQGTLFGRNTTGGLISITTRTPGKELAADFEVGYANYQTYSANAYVGGPLADNLSADISFSTVQQDDGWGTNIFNGKDAYLQVNTTTVRSKWVWDPSDQLKVTVIGDIEYQKDQNAFGNSAPFGETNAYGFTGITKGWDINSDLTSEVETKSRGLSGRIDYDLDFATFSSISGYRKSTVTTSGNDADSSPAGTLSAFDRSSKAFTQELQLVSNGKGPLNWAVGALYIKTKTDVVSLFSTLTQQDGDALGSFQDPNCFGQPGTTFCSFKSFNTASKGQLESISGYAQGTYSLTKRARLTLGARWTQDKVKQVGTFLVDTWNFPIPNSTNPSNFFPFQDDKISSSVWTWRAAFDYDLADDVLVYASANKGYKAGGFNPFNPFNPPAAPEENLAYEVGLKSTLLDNTLRLNLSGFYYDYTNIQIYQNLGTSTLFLNGPKAKVKGIDFDGSWLIGDHLTLNFAAEYLDAKFGDFPGALKWMPGPAYNPNAPLGSRGGGYVTVPGFNAKGNTLPLASDFTFSVNPVYDIEMKSGKLTLSGTYSYNDGYFMSPGNEIKQDPFHMVAGSIRYTSNPGAYVELWIKNALNERTLFVAETGTAARTRGYNPPRTYGITAGMKF